jgi:hypothetical protein
MTESEMAAKRQALGEQVLNGGLRCGTGAL